MKRSRNMTQMNLSYRKSISSGVQRIMHKRHIRYQDIEITASPSVTVGNHFSAQDEDCVQIIKQTNELATMTDLSPKTCLVWVLDNAGLFKNFNN